MKKSFTISSLWGTRVLLLIISVVLIVAVALFFILRKTESKNPQAYSKYVESYTSGVISKKSFIKIHLASAVKGVVDLGRPDPRDLFEFSPSIKGKTYWLDAQTVEFRPDENLEPGQAYESTFKLKEVSETPEDLAEFDFGFQVIMPGLSVSQNGLVSQNNTSLTYMKLTGVVNTSDFEEPKDIEKSITADFKPQLRIKWQHEPAKNRSFFTIDSVSKSDQEQTLVLKWNGENIGAPESKGEEKIAVPAKTIFKVLAVKAVQDLEDYALVQFSEPVNVGQDLNGLVGLGDLKDLRFTIDGSQIKVYAIDELHGNYAVSVNAAVTNIESAPLITSVTQTINFEDKMPAVKIAGSGTILPSSGKLVLPFEAVNLRAVDVTVIKIFENNIPQFYQVNNYAEGMELRRVAKPVVQKTIRLDNDKALNLHKKNRFTLDLDNLIKTEPGAMYRVTIGFRKAYSTFKCAEDENIQTSDEDADETDDTYEQQGIDEDDSFWENYDNYYPSNYRWADRENPCTQSYYTNERWVSRNLLASNIGLVAKRGNDNSMLVVATDLLTAKPLSGVSLELLNFQRQVLISKQTDENGLATFELAKKPYLLVAKNKSERGYLKLDDGNALPLSRFDVAGDVVQQGIKGFIYGERGVWRPGDSVHLSFLLADKLKKLPANYPITLEFYNPKNQLIKRINNSKALNGCYTFKLTTESTSPTGNWLVKVKVGGVSFTKTIKIETIMPNRLKINFNLNGRTYLKSGASSATTLTAKWLFGAPAQQLKAKVDVILKPAETKFKGFEQYTFDNPTASFDSQIRTVFEGTLNAAGSATVNTNFNEKVSAPGVLRATFTTKVFEPGGNFSIDNFSVPYHVYQSYLGIKVPEGDRLSGMLLTDRAHKIEIVNVNNDGKLTAADQQVTVEVYKIQWRWWWEQDAQESYANFTQNEYNKLVSTQQVQLNNGKGIYNFRINEPDWGRYLILVRSVNGGHVTGKSVYVDWPGWAQREQSTNPTEASMLSFTANKKKYNVGEEITLTIPTGQNGRALISIENGSRVLNTFWISTQKGQTQFKFKADASMAPNIFANITLLQPHAQTVNDLPIRMYGVIPLSIEDPATILKPVIKMPKTLKPEVQSTINISEQNGKAMTYTIALVDEGLLDLTRFATPDPHSALYAHEGLGVKTWDLFDQVLGAWGGNLERILSIGGDGSINRNVNPAKANRFKPVVKVMGPFYLAKGGSVTHKFTLPPYIGSVRAMVVAGQDGAYGSAEQTVEVKKPLMLLATLPRVIGPGERFVLPVNIFATGNNMKAVDVQVQSTNLTVQGNKGQQLNFKQSGEQMAYFDVVATNTVGVAKIRIIARSGSEQTSQDVELEIRNPNPYITNIASATIQPNQSWKFNYTPIGISASNSGAIEVSSIPPINLAKRLGYLITYPHGCVEQTTSSVFPQLSLDKLTDLSVAKKAEIERNVKIAIARLKGFQTVDGGLSYWPGQGSADEWGTNYAGHFLVEAQNAGYTLPVGLLTELVRYQQTKASTWTPNSNNFYGGDLSQAYRLYMLALAKKPEMAAMNRLRAFEYLSVAAKWRLAAAYQLAGQSAAARNLIKGLSQSITPYKQLAGTYGTELRDEAMIMETLTLMGQKAKAGQMLQTVASRLGTESWYSTQTTAFSLLAIAKFCGQNTASMPLNYSFQIDGRNGNVNSKQYLSTTSLNFTKNQAHITNKGNNVLFVRLILKGQPAAGQNNFLPNNQDALNMSVAYKTLKGQILNPAVLKQGTDFYAEVTIKNPGKMGNYEQMALTEIFPSGWEIINTRLNDGDELLSSSPYTYRDIRDDRVLTYFNIRANQTLSYKVLLNASYIGKFYLSAVQCEAMYDQKISATTPGKWIQVVK